MDLKTEFKPIDDDFLDRILTQLKNELAIQETIQFYISYCGINYAKTVYF